MVMRKNFLYSFFISFAVLISVSFCIILFSVEQKIESVSEEKSYDSVADIPARNVGLLLGAPKYVDGEINLFYLYRIDAAVALFEAEKIEYVLVSGDNKSDNSNESESMKADLLARGVPNERIYVDTAGVRTWDSIVRAEKIFQQEKIIIISQKFHTDRALLIAEDQGIDAIAFHAQDVEKRDLSLWMRERFARFRAFFDVMIDPEPLFFGDVITIPESL